VAFVADVSGIAYDALKMAVEHVLGKIKEGKKLATEDILVLYLGTIVSDLREIRTDIARLDSRMDETNKRIDETNKRIDELSKRIDDTNRRIDDLTKSLTVQRAETNRRIDETNQENRCRADDPLGDTEVVDRAGQKPPVAILESGGDWRGVSYATPPSRRKDTWLY
jgi:uncharacterized coiled-coil DUF342 family protein